jgi:hypothetical protein
VRVAPFVVAAGAVAAVAIVAAERVLPRVAARRVTARLGGPGAVEAVRVRARPAVKLLWGRADVVDVRLAELGAGRGDVSDGLADARGIRRLAVHARRARVGPLALRDLWLRKEGADLVAEATVDQADLVAVLPPGVGLRPVAGSDGTLVLEAGASVLGLRAVVRTRLTARDGCLVIAGEGPLGRLGTLTVYDDPRVRVTSVGARAVPGGFTLVAAGRLADG